MYSTALKAAIATTPVRSQAPRKESTITQPCLITTPQRKARTGDKNRLRWKDAKETALWVINCANTAEVKKWLKAIKVQLSLRLTSGWVAVCNDLAPQIAIAKQESGTQVSSNIVQLHRLKIGARSDKDRSRNFQIVQGYKASTPTKAEENIFSSPTIQKLVETFDRLIPLSDFEKVLKGMKDAIASKNWEYLRLALIGREEYKAEAWKRLSPQEREELDALIPEPIRLLKAAVKRGAIAAWKEDDEGGIFYVWKSADCEPELVTGTSVAQKFPPNASLY